MKKLNLIAQYLLQQNPSSQNQKKNLSLKKLPLKEKDRILSALAKMDNFDIIDLMRPFTAKFVVYRVDDGTHGWMKNNLTWLNDDDFLLIACADSVEDAVAKCKQLNGGLS